MVAQAQKTSPVDVNALIATHNEEINKFNSATTSTIAAFNALKSLRTLHEEHNFFTLTQSNKTISNSCWLHFFESDTEELFFDFIKNNFPERIAYDLPSTDFFMGEDGLSYVFKLNSLSKTVDFCWYDEFDQEVREIPIERYWHAKNLIEITRAANEVNRYSYIQDENNARKYIRSKAIDIIRSNKSWLDIFSYSCLKDRNITYYDRSGWESHYSEGLGWITDFSWGISTQKIVEVMSRSSFVASPKCFSEALGNYFALDGLPERRNTLDLKCSFSPGKSKSQKTPSSQGAPIDLLTPKEMLEKLQDMQKAELKTFGVKFLSERTITSILDEPYQLLFNEISDTDLVLDMVVVEGTGLVVKTFTIKYREFDQNGLEAEFKKVKTKHRVTAAIDKEAEKKFLKDLARANNKLFPLSERRNRCHIPVTFYEYTSKEGTKCYLYTLLSEGSKNFHYVGNKTYEEILTPVVTRSILNERKSLLTRMQSPHTVSTNAITSTISSNFSPPTSVLGYFAYLKYQSDKAYHEYRMKIYQFLENHPLPPFTFTSSPSNPYVFCVECNKTNHQFWAKSNEEFIQNLLDILMSVTSDENVISKFCFEIYDFLDDLNSRKR